MSDSRQRKPQDFDRDAPASEAAKQQRMAGTSSGPQEAQQSPRTEKQPPQSSGRRDPAHEHPPSVRKGYENAETPEKQGDGDPGPDQLRERPSAQGHKGGPQRD